MTLTIISHTEHYKTSAGCIVGHGSTITEINHFLEIFDHVIHLAMLRPGNAPDSSLPYVSDRIQFIPIPAVGGKGIGAKWSIVWKAPETLRIVGRYLKKADYFQFRAPTGIGVYLIPYLMCVKKEGWFKYAGNWQKPSSFLYQFQKWMLEKQRKKVTINGHWPNQLEHCLSFENPCLTNLELEEGINVIKDKKLIPGQIEICYVGRMEASKGIDLLLDALQWLDALTLEKIKKVHLVGDGPKLPLYKERTKTINIPLSFYGSMDREGVRSVFKKSHFLVLPSTSEGFPKVVSEGLNYGCVPIVTNMPAIAEKIKEGVNGFLIPFPDCQSVSHMLKTSLDLSENQYEVLKGESRKIIETFTYNYYNKRIQTEILKEMES